MPSCANDYVPVIDLAESCMDEPSDDELKLALQFLPDIYRDMLICLDNIEE